MMKLFKRLQVFLLYARSDQEAVHHLYTHLVKDGVKVWLDVENILPGQDWAHAIHQAILGSDIIVVCLSEQFNQQGGYRHQELRLALAKAKSLPEETIFLVPARLENCNLPESLSRWQRVDLFEPDGYKNLIYMLRQYILLAK